MKKITLLILLLFTGIIGYSQCTTTTGGLWPTSVVTVLNDGSAETISPNNWPNAEVSFIDGLVVGNTYTVTGDQPIFITVAETIADFSTTGAILGSGQNSVNFTATTPQIRIFWHVSSACDTQASGDTATSIQCTDPSCVCVETAAPSAATITEPANGATVDIDYSNPAEPSVGLFSWTDGTMGGGITTNDISLGEMPTADDIGVVTDAANGTNIIFPGWQPNTTYYWFVISNNCFGSTNSPIFSFTTSACSGVLPTASGAISPADGATGVEINYGATTNNINPFEFTESGTGADGFTINIGETPTGDDIGSITDFDSGGGINFNWQPNTTYYWYITGNNCAGGTDSSVFSFTTADCTESAAPPAVSTPNPANLSFGVPVNSNGNSVTLSWAGSVPGASYTLYFDTVNPPVQSFDNFESGDVINGVALNTDYFWRIDPINCAGFTTGSVWGFRTDSQLSIDEVEIAEVFSISPNPTNGVLNINSSKDVDNVVVFNLLGQSVAKFNANTIKDNSIDISNLSNGLYLLQITAGDNVQTLRVNKK